MFFFRKLWAQIKKDIIDLLHGAGNGQARLERTNFSQIVLIAKKEALSTSGDYRPIALLNSSLKIVSKILTNRLILLIGDLIGKL